LPRRRHIEEIGLSQRGGKAAFGKKLGCAVQRCGVQVYAADLLCDSGRLRAQSAQLVGRRDEEDGLAAGRIQDARGRISSARGRRRSCGKSSEDMPQRLAGDVDRASGRRRRRLAAEEGQSLPDHDGPIVNGGNTR
jgi:hypothetical protein